MTIWCVFVSAACGLLQFIDSYPKVVLAVLVLLMLVPAFEIERRRWFHAPRTEAGS